jgi:hypothetical protein
MIEPAVYQRIGLVRQTTNATNLSAMMRYGSFPWASQRLDM